VAIGSHIAYFTTEPIETGGFASRLFQLLTKGRDYDDAAAAERPHLLAEAMVRAHTTGTTDPRTAMASYRSDRHEPVGTGAAAAGGGPPQSVGSTSFLVTDRDGQAVACTLHMNAPFGTGKLVPGFGFLTAPKAS